MASTEEQISQLRSAIAAQESLRSTLGDAVVDLTVTALRAQLASFESQQRDAGQPKSALSPEALLAQLQSYVPRQLAEKMRASGLIEGERRQVTVLFADISGFTALSEKLDAEVVASLVNDCLKELVLVVYQHEGMVDKFVGDCIMVVFGAPVALEDDAERACRAALAMREKLRDFNRRWIGRLGQELDLHIGINTGMVIAGNVGSDLRMSYTVLGDTVNLTARLQDAAKAGHIFVSRNTYRLTRGAFGFQELPPIQVKGKRDPIPLYELLHAKIQPEKSRGLEGLSSPLVGRDDARRRFAKSLASLAKGRGGIVSVMGEAGIGKSRLLAELREREGKDLAWLEGRCFAFSRALSYAPFLDMLRRFSGIADEDGEAEARASLRERLEQVFPGESQAQAVLAQLLSMRLAPEEAAAMKALSGENYQRLLFSTIEDFLRRHAAQKPVVLVLEDLHWCDQSSIALIRHLLPITTQAPVVLVLLSRPKREAPENWEKLGAALDAVKDRCEEIALEPLTDQAGHELVMKLLDGSPLPEKLNATILGKADGNPFFVEEVLRSLVERGALVRDDGKWRVTGLVESIQVPDTLQGVLHARLDRLPEESRRVIQKAAVIGRVFLYRVLEHMARGEAGLEQQVATLEDSELVRERSRTPEIEYIFQHALTQEVAYQTLLTPARKLLHRHVGEAMEAVFSERIGEFTALLAGHFFHGESWEKALEYSTRAADSAASLHAQAEARDHYRHALESLKHLPDNEANRRNLVDVSVHLVNASLQAEAPDKNLAILDAAAKVAAALADPAREARVRLWTGRVHYLAGRPREAIGYFQKVLEVAPALGDPELMALPGAVIGRALFLQGRFAKARHLLEQTIPLLEKVNNRHELLFAHLYRAASRACMGEIKEALADMDGVLKMAKASRNPNAETMTHTAAAMIQLVAGRHADAIEDARKALGIAEQNGDAMFRYSSNAFMAWGQGGLGDFESSKRHWAAAHEAARPLGGRLLLGEWLAAIEAETMLDGGDGAGALAQAEKALGIAKAAGSVVAEALAERALGRALAAASPPRWDEAETLLTASLVKLDEIGAKFDQTRTLLALGKIHHARKNPKGATTVLERARDLAKECGLVREEKRANDLLGKLAPT